MSSKELGTTLSPLAAIAGGENGIEMNEVDEVDDIAAQSRKSSKKSAKRISLVAQIEEVPSLLKKPFRISQKMAFTISCGCQTVIDKKTYIALGDPLGGIHLYEVSDSSRNLSVCINLVPNFEGSEETFAAKVSVTALHFYREGKDLFLLAGFKNGKVILLLVPITKITLREDKLRSSLVGIGATTTANRRLSQNSNFTGCEAWKINYDKSETAVHSFSVTAYGSQTFVAIGVEAKSLFVVELSKVRTTPTKTHYFSLHALNTQGSKLDPEQHSENITCVGLKVAAKQHQGRSARRVNLIAVTGSGDRTIRLWPIYVVEVAEEGTGSGGTMNRLFARNKSRRGDDLACAPADSHTISSSPDRGHTDTVTSVIFYGDSMIISGDASGEVIIWDEQVSFAEEDKSPFLIPLRRFNNHKSAFITSVSMLRMLTPEHSYNPILIVAGDNGLSLFDFFREEEFRQLSTDGKKVETMLVDYLDYDNILTYNFWTCVTMDEVLTTWNFASGEIENILQMETSMEGHSGKISAMTFYDDGRQKMLLTASKVDKSVRLFETQNAKQVSLILNEAKPERAELNQFKVNQSKDLSCSYSEVVGAYPTAICAVPAQGIFIGTDQGELSFWRFDEENENQPIRVSAIFDMQCDGITAITSFITSADEVVVAIGSGDRHVKLITGLTEPGAVKLSHVNDLSGGHVDSSVQSLIIWKPQSGGEEEAEGNGESAAQQQHFLISNGSSGKVCIWSLDPNNCFEEPPQLMQVIFHNGSALLCPCEEFIISVGTEDGMLLTWAPQVIKKINKKDDLKSKFIVHDTTDTQESFIKTLGIKSKVAAIGLCFDPDHTRRVFISFENGEVCVIDPITKVLIEPAKYHPEGKHAANETAVVAASKNGVAEPKKVMKHFQSAAHFLTGVVANTTQPVGRGGGGGGGGGSGSSSSNASYITTFVHCEIPEFNVSIWTGGASDGKVHFQIVRTSDDNDSSAAPAKNLTIEGRTGAIRMMKTARLMNKNNDKVLLALKNDGTVIQADLSRGRLKALLPLEFDPNQSDFPDSEIFMPEIIALDVNEASNDDGDDTVASYALCAYQKLVSLFTLTSDNNKQRVLESEHVLSRYYKDAIVHARLCVPDAQAADMIMITAHIINSSHPLQLVYIRNGETQNTTKITIKEILDALKPVDATLRKVDITCMAIAQGKQIIFAGCKTTSPLIIHFKDDTKCEAFTLDTSLKGNITCIDVAEVANARKSNAEIVTGHADGTVVAWDLKGKKARYTCDAIESGSAITSIKLILDLSVVVGKNENFIIIGADDNSIRLLSFSNSLTVLRIFENHTKLVTAIELVQLGNRDPMLFTASEDTLLIARDTYFMATKTPPGPRAVIKNFSMDCKALSLTSGKASKKANASKPWSRIELLLKGVAKSRAAFFTENAHLFADCALLATDQGLSFLQKYLQHVTDHVLMKYYPIVDASHTVPIRMNLLEVAIESDNKRAVSIVVDALLKELNQALDDKDDYLPQLYPPGRNLACTLIQSLAEKYPVLFNGFICGIKLMKVHPNLLGGTKVKYAFGENENEFRQVDVSRNLLTLWPTIDGAKSSCNSASDGKEEWAIAMYIPLPFAANNDTLAAFIKNCEDVNNVNLYDSDVGKLTLSFSWRTFGESVHWRAFGKHLVYTAIYSISLFIFSYWSHGGATDNNQSTKNFLTFLAYLSVVICLIASTYFIGMEVKEVYVTDKGDWSKHFGEMWNVIDAMTHITMFMGAIARLSAGNDTVFSRSTLAFCGIFIYFKILYFLRGFPLTGPLVKMVFQIAADIRPFLLVLWIVIFGFTQAFWIISNIDSSNPFGVFDTGMLNMFDYMMGNFDSGFDGTAQGQVGTILFIIFMLGVPLLLLNLLIALMGDSFANVRARGEAQYRLEQATILHEQFYLVSSEAAFDPKFIHVLLRGTDIELQQDNQEDAAVLSEKVTALEAKLDKILKMMSASPAFAAVTLSDSEDEEDEDEEDEDSDEDEDDSDEYDEDEDSEDDEDEDVPPEEEAAGMQDTYKSWLHEHVLERSSGEGWGCDGRRQPGGCKQGCTGFRQSAGWVRFRCDDCDFDLCAGCVLLTREADTDKPQLQAYAIDCHEHPLMRCFDKRGWNCDGSNLDEGCQKAKESGDESASTRGWLRHRCNLCDFDMCLPCVNKHLTSTVPLLTETKPPPRKEEDSETADEEEEEEKEDEEADDSDGDRDYGEDDEDED